MCKITQTLDSDKKTQWKMHTIKVFERKRRKIRDSVSLIFPSAFIQLYVGRLFSILISFTLFHPSELNVFSTLKLYQIVRCAVGRFCLSGFIGYFCPRLNFNSLIMTSMNLLLRLSRKQGYHQGSLTLRLIHKRRVKNITLKGCRLYPHEWDKKLQKVIYPENDPFRTVYLERVQQILTEEVRQLHGHLLAIRERVHYSVEDVVSLYRIRRDENKLSGFTESLSRELELRGQFRTARAYRTVTRRLIRFNGDEDIPFSQINACLIKDFESYLRDHGRLPNTISYYMRNLRSIYNKALSTKRFKAHLDESPFSEVFTGATKTMKRSLSLAEVKKLCSLDFVSFFIQKFPYNESYHQAERLYASHRYFLFCFFARGMCFIDLAYLKKDNLKNGLISYVRRKTGRQMEVRITPEMQAIIDSFSFQVSDSPYLFPIITPTKGEIDPRRLARLQYDTALRAQNLLLKKLASLAKIDKPISTHWARHTWATIGKQEQVPLQVLSECLGHSSEKTTLIYLGLLENSVLDEANRTITSALQSYPVCSAPIPISF